MTRCWACKRFMLPDLIRCLHCGAVNPDREEALVGGGITKNKTTTLDKVEAIELARIWTGGPWDEAWSGFVPSSATLFGAPAGIGKSSLCMQIVALMASMSGKRAYYLSAEQSPGEIKNFTDRLQLDPKLFRVLSAMGGGAEIDAGLLKDDPPACFVVDSVSALCGKDFAAQLVVVKSFKKLAVKYSAPAFLISHVNKSQDFAGSMAMQHEPDVVMTFDIPDKKDMVELEEQGVEKNLIGSDDIRVLRPWKNRFGPSHRSTFLLMTEHGLVALPKKEDKQPRSRTATPPPPSPIATEIGEKFHPLPPDEIESDGQRLVRRKKKAPKPARAEAIEGSAPKRGRPGMERTVDGKKVARERRKKTAA